MIFYRLYCLIFYSLCFQAIKVRIVETGIMNNRSLFILLLFTCSFCSCKKNSNSDTTQQSQPVVVSLLCTLPSVLHESSGLCFTDGNLWSFGDSGNPNSIYKIDTSTGVILQTVTIQNYPNIDWEDISADSTFMYIGDFGNNNGNRTNLKKSGLSLIIA